LAGESDGKRPILGRAGPPRAGLDLRGRELKGSEARPIVAFAEFSTPTGQRRQRVDRLAGANLPAGTFD